ncbi:hypothetical protein [Marinitenerispora sediminis]|uniref:Uncharacterized protein n=1 Tax=Marinitenerispora sediminis TaxID=1931232 RepID=A0A368T306_9ACTN|nr:hypothetical protein [Marinitenerispora sediminis]RCV49114.1 hypothetical protein DEF28_21690 [Marinitenerispora sediminis]RCV51839.1 hypothetical protein DEF23_19745 [Marinitenerispora sediminis]RCV55808.1 hypothetical protein DEF24_17385 [Marinitenerispora sediminis]
MHTNHLGRALAVTLTLALTTTACGGGADPDEAVPGDATPSESPETRIPAEDLSGFVMFHVGGGEPYLTFHGADDGVQRTQLDLSGVVAGDLNIDAMQAAHFAFTADFRYAAYEGASGVHLGSLDDAAFAYGDTVLLQPEETGSFGDGAYAYERPAFSPDGSELWMVRSDDSGGPDQIVATSVTDAGQAAPRQVGEVPRGTVPVRYTEPGWRPALVSLDTVYAIGSGNELQVADQAPAEEGPSGLRYAVAGDEIIPINFRSDGGGGYIGPLNAAGGTGEVTNLHRFSLSPDGELSNETEVVGDLGVVMDDYWADAANQRVLVTANGRFFQAPFEGAGEPEELFPELAFEGPDAGSSEIGDRLLGFFPVPE